MHAEIFCVCESATFRDGILNMNGVYSGACVPALPVQFDGFTIVTRIRFDLTEAGPHHLKITISDPKGQLSPVPIESDINVASESGLSHVFFTGLIGNSNFQISEEGPTTLRLYVDDEEIDDCIFTVGKRP